jgi:hypothetical protein
MSREIRLLRLPPRGGRAQYAGPLPKVEVGTQAGAAGCGRDALSC